MVQWNWRSIPLSCFCGSLFLIGLTMFSTVELRYIRLCLKQKIETEREELKGMDEDSDEYMEKANDVMALDSIVAKIDKGRGAGR